MQSTHSNSSLCNLESILQKVREEKSRLMLFNQCCLTLRWKALQASHLWHIFLTWKWLEVIYFYYGLFSPGEMSLASALTTSLLCTIVVGLVVKGRKGVRLWHPKSHIVRKCAHSVWYTQIIFSLAPSSHNSGTCIIMFVEPVDSLDGTMKVWIIH